MIEVPEIPKSFINKKLNEEIKRGLMKSKYFIS